MYADDTAILARNKNPNYIQIALNRHLKALEDWFIKWKIEINVSKTEAIMFANARRYSSFPPIKINDRIIPWSQELDCPVRGISNGTLKEYKERKVWKLGKFRSERKLILIEVTRGGVRPPGHQLYLTCESRHAFQGSGIINVTTTCKEGKWQPEPVCLS
ncbi:hypothetical protein AVEN_169259-1, partial [Araneus ventricosus]